MMWLRMFDSLLLDLPCKFTLAIAWNICKLKVGEIKNKKKLKLMRSFFFFYLFFYYYYYLLCLNWSIQLSIDESSVQSRLLIESAPRNLDVIPWIVWWSHLLWIYQMIRWNPMSGKWELITICLKAMMLVCGEQS